MSYNRVLEKLVESEDDLVGLVAYGLHKRSKRDWLTSFREDKSRLPTADEEDAYVQGQLLLDNLGRLRNQATAMLTSYSDYLVQQAAPEIREDAINNHVLERTRETLRIIQGQRTVWTQMGTAVLGALAYTLVLIVIALALRFVGIDLLTVLETLPSPGS